MENNIYENNPEVEYQAPVEQPFEIPAEDTAFDFGANEQPKKKSFIEKIKSIPKKVWILIGAGIAAIIAVIVVLSLLGNTPEAPVKAAEKILNSKSASKMIDQLPSVLNGFGESEAKKVLKILKKSDQYDDAIEDANDAVEELREQLADEYGDNFKIKLKVVEKEELEKDDTKAFRNQLRNIADMKDRIDDMDSDDYEDMADQLGITKSQAKDLVKALESFFDKCKDAKVSEGYELTVEASITGSEVDDPETFEFSINVFKVDGRWVPDVFSLYQDFYREIAYGMMGGMNYYY